MTGGPGGPHPCRTPLIVGRFTPKTALFSMGFSGTPKDMGPPYGKLPLIGNGGGPTIGGP